MFVFPPLTNGCFTFLMNGCQVITASWCTVSVLLLLMQSPSPIIKTMTQNHVISILLPHDFTCVCYGRGYLEKKTKQNKTTPPYRSLPLLNIVQCFFADMGYSSMSMSSVRVEVILSSSRFQAVHTYASELNALEVDVLDLGCESCELKWSRGQFAVVGYRPNFTRAS